MASELEAAIAELVGAAELIVSRAPPSFTVPLAAALRRYRDAGGADGVEAPAVPTARRDGARHHPLRVTRGPAPSGWLNVPAIASIGPPSEWRATRGGWRTLPDPPQLWHTPPWLLRTPPRVPVPLQSGQGDSWMTSRSAIVRR